jgi:hypothetical protein
MSKWRRVTGIQRDSDLSVPISPRGRSRLPCRTPLAQFSSVRLRSLVVVVSMGALTQSTRDLVEVTKPALGCEVVCNDSIRHLALSRAPIAELKPPNIWLDAARRTTAARLARTGGAPRGGRSATAAERTYAPKRARHRRGDTVAMTGSSSGMDGQSGRLPSPREQ